MVSTNAINIVRSIVLAINLCRRVPISSLLNLMRSTGDLVFSPTLLYLTVSSLRLRRTLSQFLKIVFRSDCDCDGKAALRSVCLALSKAECRARTSVWR